MRGVVSNSSRGSTGLPQSFRMISSTPERIVRVRMASAATENDAAKNDNANGADEAVIEIEGGKKDGGDNFVLFETVVVFGVVFVLLSLSIINVAVFCCCRSW